VRLCTVIFTLTKNVVLSFHYFSEFGSASIIRCNAHDTTLSSLSACRITLSSPRVHDIALLVLYVHATVLSSISANDTALYSLYARDTALSSLSAHDTALHLALMM
jgi:hypothetical protein